MTNHKYLSELDAPNCVCSPTYVETDSPMHQWMLQNVDDFDPDNRVKYLFGYDIDRLSEIGSKYRDNIYIFGNDDESFCPRFDDIDDRSTDYIILNYEGSDNSGINTLAVLTPLTDKEIKHLERGDKIVAVPHARSDFTNSMKEYVNRRVTFREVEHSSSSGIISVRIQEDPNDFNYHTLHLFVSSALRKEIHGRVGRETLEQPEITKEDTEPNYGTEDNLPKYKQGDILVSEDDDYFGLVMASGKSGFRCEKCVPLTERPSVARVPDIYDEQIALYRYQLKPATYLTRDEIRDLNEGDLVYIHPSSVDTCHWNSTGMGKYLGTYQKVKFINSNTLYFENCTQECGSDTYWCFFDANLILVKDAPKAPEYPLGTVFISTDGDLEGLVRTSIEVCDDHGCQYATDLYNVNEADRSNEATQCLYKLEMEVAAPMTRDDVLNLKQGDLIYIDPRSKEWENWLCEMDEYLGTYQEVSGINSGMLELQCSAAFHFTGASLFLIKKAVTSSEQPPVASHDDVVDALPKVDLEAAVNYVLPTDYEETPIETEEGNEEMASTTSVNVHTTDAPINKIEETTIYGYVLSKLNETDLRNLLNRIASDRQSLADLDLGKVTKDSYQGRQLAQLDAAKVAVIGALDALED